MRPLLCLVLLSLPLQADLTLHYKSSYQFAPNLSAEITGAMTKQMAASLPAETQIRIHGDQLISLYGQLTCIIDSARQQITFLHPPSKRYATTTTADLARSLAATRLAPEGLDIDVKASKSGKTAVVHQVPTEETVITITITVPNPNGPPVATRMELHNWHATSAALDRFPELKQWDAKKWTSIPGLLPSGPMSIAGPQAATEKLRAAMRSLLNDSTGVSLKTETRIFMSSIAADAPLVSTTLELDTFSADPIPDSAFQIPADYNSAPLSDLLEEFNPAKPRIPPGVPGK